MTRASGGPLPDGRVALLFTDVQGSTALLHRLGAAYGHVLDAHDRILRGVWEEFGGVEVDNEGDAFFVAFSDHARAIEAVTAAQRRLADEAWPDGAEVKVRMGLHSGEPAIRGRKYWGVDVHYAARLGSAAHGGQVILSSDMRTQVPRAPVEALGTHGLKDFPAARQLFHLVVAGSTAADSPPPRTLTAIRSNLPTVDTPLIGRETVLTDLRAHLTGDSHLVTLIGPGGIGKTRTAIAVGHDVTAEFSDGVTFVAMASLTDAGSVVPAIAEALQEELRGTDGPDALAQLLRERQVLVILDNAEHLPGLAEVLAPLVATTPQARWLVTSQAPLGLRGETQVRLEALDEPAAAALFVERARARQSTFSVEPDEEALLTGLCRDLDGMPLALELAAARAPTLGLHRLTQALGRDPDAALGRGAPDLPARQRGLRAALDWTASLLTPTERDAYAGCGAFAEAWSIEDLEFLLEGSTEAWQVWDALARLLDLSLVVQRGDGRFTMPERVRRHATELLQATDGEHCTRRRHAELVLSTFHRLVQQERHVQFRSAMAAVEDFLPEVQHALLWASVHDTDIYRLLLGSTGWGLGWFDRHHPWLADLVGFARAQDPGDLAQGRVWAFACTQMAGVDDLTERRTWLERALARFLELDDHPWVAETYMTQFEFECVAGRPAVGLEALRTGREYAEAHGLTDQARSFEDCVAIALLANGDYEGAERRIRPWLDDPTRASWARAGVATFLADCSFGQGAYPEAVAWYAEDLRGLPRSERANALLQVKWIAVSCAALGFDQLAVELKAAVDAVVEELGVSTDSSVQVGGALDHLEAALRRLPPDDVQAARARGLQLDYDALIERTLEAAADVVAAGPGT